MLSDDDSTDDEYLLRALEESRMQYERETSNRDSTSRSFNEINIAAAEENSDDLELQQAIQASLSQDSLPQKMETHTDEYDENDYKLQQAIQDSLNPTAAALRKRNYNRENNLAAQTNPSKRQQQNNTPSGDHIMQDITNYYNHNMHNDEAMSPPPPFNYFSHSEEFQFFGDQNTSSEQPGLPIENYGYRHNKHINLNQNQRRRHENSHNFLEQMHLNQISQRSQQDDLLDVMIQEDQYQKYISYLDDTEKSEIENWSNLTTHSKNQILNKLKNIQKRQADQDRHLLQQQSLELEEEIEKWKLDKKKAKKIKKEKQEKQQAKKKEGNRRLENEKIIKERKIERKKRLKEIQKEMKIVRRDKTLTRDEKQIRLDELKDEDRQIRFIETL
jgi:hypothetical protein